MRMNEKRAQLIPLLSFPVVLTIGIMLIPVVTDYTDHRLAEQAVAQVGRWFSGHIISAVGFSLSILAVGVVEKHLPSDADLLLKLSKPMVVVGAGLYAAGLGADGVGPVAVQAAGYSPVIFFDGSGMWVTGVFIGGTIVFGLGILLTVIASIRQGLIKGPGRYVSFISAILFMIAPMILSGWALYGVAATVFGVFVPLTIGVMRTGKTDLA